MRIRHWYTGTGSALGLALAAALIMRGGVLSPGAEGVPAGEAVTAMQPERVESATQARDGTSEGIKVHGHWTIEVREPDGRLVETREFENRLVANGAMTLANLLGRAESAGLWEIHLVGSSICVSATGLQTQCKLVESTSGQSGPEFIPSLTVSVANEVDLVLEGNATAQDDGQISFVQTRMSPCNADVSPEECAVVGGASPRSVTDVGIAPVAVATGQSISVRVVLSFS